MTIENKEETIKKSLFFIGRLTFLDFGVNSKFMAVIWGSLKRMRWIFLYFLEQLKLGKNESMAKCC